MSLGCYWAWCPINTIEVSVDLVELVDLVLGGRQISGCCHAGVKQRDGWQRNKVGIMRKEEDRGGVCRRV